MNLKALFKKSQLNSIRENNNTYYSPEHIPVNAPVVLHLNHLKYCQSYGEEEIRCLGETYHEQSRSDSIFGIF